MRRRSRSRSRSRDRRRDPRDSGRPGGGWGGGRRSLSRSPSPRARWGQGTAGGPNANDEQQGDGPLRVGRVTAVISNRGSNSFAIINGNTKANMIQFLNKNEFPPKINDQVRYCQRETNNKRGNHNPRASGKGGGNKRVHNKFEAFRIQIVQKNGQMREFYHKGKCKTGDQSKYVHPPTDSSSGISTGRDGGGRNKNRGRNGGGQGNRPRNLKKGSVGGAGNNNSQRNDNKVHPNQRNKNSRKGAQQHAQQNQKQQRQRNGNQRNTNNPQRNGSSRGGKSVDNKGGRGRKRKKK